jgi:hypothetical protein
MEAFRDCGWDPGTQDAIDATNSSKRLLLPETVLEPMGGSVGTVIAFVGDDSDVDEGNVDDIGDGVGHADDGREDGDGEGYL